MVKETLFQEAVYVAHKIVLGQYDELDQQGKLKLWKREDILRELSDYGGKLTEASIDDYRTSFDYIRIDHTNRYMVYLDFWIDRVRSDLTLICKIGIDEHGGIEFSHIEDMHVL